MAKHSCKRMGYTQATRLLLSAALVMGLASSPAWAGQQSSMSSPQAKTAQASGKKGARTTPVKSGETATQRKSTTATSASSALWAGKRDPFKLPEVGGGKGGAGNIMESGPGGVLPGGERGLVISQLILEGTVREVTENKMIAVVTNETKRAYFLRENQSVYNGVVSKITPDAVTFTENVLDAEGRVTTREVVKRLGSAPGEER